MRKVLTILTSIGIFFLMVTAYAEPPAASTSKDSTLVSMSGTVEVAPAKSEAWKPARTNQKLTPGERVRTGKKSRAAIRLPNNNILRISEDTTYSIPDLARPAGQ